MTNIVVSVTRRHKSFLNKKAHKLEIKVSELVRRILDEHMEKYEDERKKDN